MYDLQTDMTSLKTLYFNRRLWNQILDDIEVRAVVFKDGSEYSAIIQFDVLCINYKLYSMVLSAVKAAGLKEFSSKNLLICATHSHTCPDVNFDPNSDNYCTFAARKAAEALKSAQESLRDGTLYYGMTQDARFQFNRRCFI